MISPDIKFAIPQDAFRQIQSLRDRVGLGQAVARAMDDVNTKVVANIQQRISGRGVRRGGPSPQGENVGVDRGYLRRSIGRSRALVVGSAEFVEVRSAVGSNAAFGGVPGYEQFMAAESVRYAAIHEFGGVIEHPARQARLRFVKGRFASEKKYQKRKGKGETFTRTAAIPARRQVMRARPYVHPEVEAASDMYSKALDYRVREWAGKRGLN